jgi:hypothetical protein
MPIGPRTFVDDTVIEFSALPATVVATPLNPNAVDFHRQATIFFLLPQV